MKRFLILTFTLIAFLLLTLPSFAFTPGKWSHKDQFVFFKGKKGPSKEIVRNSEGQVIYVAEYVYDEDGHLVQETYSDKEGKSDGKTIFRYTEGLVTSEEVYGQNNTLVERKDFVYKGKILKRLVVKNFEGKNLISYTLETDKDGMLVSGEGKNSESKDVESFRIIPDPKKLNVQIQFLLDDKKIKLGEIHFKYDAKGNLVEREFFQAEVHRVNKLKYKTDGSLESFSFHVKQGDNWVLEKTHFLLYDENSKSKVSKQDKKEEFLSNGNNSPIEH
ncbi:hypothetical protein LPTSP3_g36050 [Leptospira kobayashii]|uniref:MORN repeat protein n=1 Tax=Leptospira kobayashii TaxID=1917830 RepID=A0ABN6KHF1_9LEPT|nr:hypothetical protein [Leptospira kobayashii]BDA80675.1 hypothetical protein LPTSP3_g36050 [Leptospira kobayashii]